MRRIGLTLLALMLIFSSTSCGFAGASRQRATTQSSGQQPGQAAAQTPTTQPTEEPVPTPSPQPSPEVSSQAEPSPTPVPPAEGTITIEEPAPQAAITSPVHVKGSTDFWPFEATLTVQIKDAEGNIIGVGPVMVQAPDIGMGGPFEGQIEFTAPATSQNGTLEVMEISAKDGSVVVMESVPVRLGDQTGQASVSEILLDAPVAGQAVTLPLHIALRDARADDQLRARLSDTDGTVLEQPLEVVVGNDGVGYVVQNMTWLTESQPPALGPGDATFEIVRGDGNVLASVPVMILPEEQTRLVKVAWLGSPDGGELILFDQRVPATPRIGTSALQELLNGPIDGNFAGATTALPTVRDIVTFPERGSDWGYEVKLIELTINDGVAVANFSKEMWAYGGGSARVQAIRQQIETTLKQFDSVQDVVIQIEGQTEGVLEP